MKAVFAVVARRDDQLKGTAGRRKCRSIIPNLILDNFKI